MKAFLTGVAAAIILAVAASFVLDMEVQKEAETAFQTRGVRL
ncbi:hypothetical protein [Pseudoroseomonas cervicalis]|nr:hypothetical protein [Pseudoroseomonas cervicalis]MDQ1081231.1 hypothetical protein [Pseudoroseomonas cervicalis]